MTDHPLTEDEVARVEQFGKLFKELPPHDLFFDLVGRLCCEWRAQRERIGELEAKLNNWTLTAKTLLAADKNIEPRASRAEGR